MRNVLTKRQRERVVSEWVERILTSERYHDGGDGAMAAHIDARCCGMSDTLEAILIDRERGADWREFNSIADEINERVEAARKERGMTDADIGELADTQQWVREHPPVNTLALKHTAGNAYVLTGVGSVVIKVAKGPNGSNLWIGIADDGTVLGVALYADDGDPHYGMLSASYEQSDE